MGVAGVVLGILGVSMWKCPEGFNSGQGHSSVRDRKKKNLFLGGGGLRGADRTSCVG